MAAFTNVRELPPMKCPSCAAEVTTDSIFCPQCGQRLDGAPVKTPAEQMRAAKAAAAGGADSDVESLLWSGGFSWKAMLGYWLLAILATIGAIAVAVLGIAIPGVPIAAGVIVLLVWVFVIGYFLYQRISLAYELTNQRLVHHYGILTRVTNRIEVIDIDDIKFTQNILERMLGVGTIQILSTDVSDP